jgi:Na+/H+-dicarboxylate symporter
MMSLGDKVKAARDVIDAFAKVAFRMIELIVQLAPVAIFSFISWMVATMGADIILALMKLVVIVIGACFLQYLFFGALILFFARVNPLKFYKKCSLRKSWPSLPAARKQRFLLL